VIVYSGEPPKDIYMGFEWAADDPVCVELNRPTSRHRDPAQTRKWGQRRIPCRAPGIGTSLSAKNGTSACAARRSRHALGLEQQRHVHPGAQGQHHL